MLVVVVADARARAIMSANRARRRRRRKLSRARAAAAALASARIEAAARFDAALGGVGGDSDGGGERGARTQENELIHAAGSGNFLQVCASSRTLFFCGWSPVEFFFCFAAAFRLFLYKMRKSTNNLCLLVRFIT